MAQIQTLTRPVTSLLQGNCDTIRTQQPADWPKHKAGSCHHHRHHQASYVLTLTFSNYWADQ